MKGALHKRKDGKWYITYTLLVPSFGMYNNFLPLHPDDIPQAEKMSEVYNRVDFDIVNEFTHPEFYQGVGWGDGIQYAKLK